MQAKRTRHCASGGTFEMCVARQTMFHVWLNASRGNVLWQVALSSKPMRGTSEKLAKNKVAVLFRQVKMETLLLQLAGRSAGWPVGRRLAGQPVGRSANRARSTGPVSPVARSPVKTPLVPPFCIIDHKLTIAYHCSPFFWAC